MIVNNLKLPFIDNLIEKNCYKQSTTDQKIDTIQLIYIKTLEAINLLKTKNLSEFDGLVGDQACQIRALKIALLCENDFSSEEEAIRANLKEIENMKEKKQELENNKNLSYKKGEDNKDLLEKYNRKKKKLTNSKQEYINKKILVSEDFLFMVRAYFLKISAKINPLTNYPQGIDPTRINIPDLNCGMAISTNVFDCMQFLLSKQSVDFVKKLSAENLIERAVIKKSQEITIGNNKNIKTKETKKMELPFFYMNKVIFTRVLKKNIPILLKIRETAKKIFSCIVLFPENAEVKSVAIIVEASSSASKETLESFEFKQKLRSTGILQIMDYNAAQHSQYTDMQDLDENQKNIKSKAIQEGYSQQNPFMCCVDHVFCDVLENQLGDKK